MLGVSSTIYFFSNSNPDRAQKQTITAAKKIEHGGDRAILTLADGQKIILDEAANGELAKSSGIKITKAADGRLVYTVTNEEPNDLTVKYNTIETPKGGQYQINLPDGSLVWLNAASKLTFPTRFVGEARLVTLAGEGYFEISKNKAMPFKVKTSRQEVEVLGTHFNISAYTDETYTRTTLLEGAVKVKLLNEQQSSVLKIGEQAVLSSNSLTVDKVDVEAAVAWKNGYFRFDDEALETIMNKVARWYNVDVVYEQPKLKSEKLGGITTRFSEVSSLLKMLELTGKVKFKIEGRQITVTAP
ncbi:fec operon regulator FecR [compost metagenome]